jgi:hypothetical protein
MRVRPSEGLGSAVLEDGCDKWYQSRPSRFRVRVSVRAYSAWRVWALVECMAYGAALDVRLCAEGDLPRYGLVCGHMARVGSDGTLSMAYSAGTGCMVVKLDRRGRRIL